VTQPLPEKIHMPAPQNQFAVIREAECIGCTKCIQACPVDAILGSAKNMHTVLATECIGCELCVAPCPVDCIDMIGLPEKSACFEKSKADSALVRYHARHQRLASEIITHRMSNTLSKPSLTTLAEKQAFIQAAVLRVKIKKPT
jgi:electron transport complex protein RnfB